MRVTKKPLIIDLKKEENGTYTLDFATFKMYDVSESEFPSLCYPFILGGEKIEVHADTEENFYKFVECTNRNGRAKYFFEPDNPALQNYLINYMNCHGKYDSMALKGFLKGKPILFIGAGSSLRENVDIVRYAVKSGAYFSVCGGTAIHLCDQYGIYPDLALGLDPHAHEYDRFKHLSEEFQSRVVLYAGSYLESRSFNNYNGTVIVQRGFETFNIHTFLEPDLDQMIDEGDIGVSTWLPNLAEYWDAGEVHYIGCDLCYHTDGTEYGKDQEKFFKDKTEQRYEFQGKATRHNWVLECEQLGEYAKKFSHRMFINHSGGLTIDGWDEQPPASLHLPSGNLDPITIPLKKINIRGRRAKLKKLANEFKEILDNYPKFSTDSNAYKHILHGYEILMMHYWIKDGLFNHSQLYLVSLRLHELINKVLKGMKQLDRRHIRPSPYTPLKDYRNG